MLFSYNRAVHDMQGSPPSERVAGGFFVASALLGYGKGREPAHHRRYCADTIARKHESRENPGYLEPLQRNPTKLWTIMITMEYNNDRLLHRITL